MSHVEAEILLVEDNPGDVRLTQEAMRRSKLANRLHVVGDGEQALDFLFRRGAFPNAPTPDLVMLDLNLPRIDGHTVLAEIKADPSLRAIPVVVLTTSDSDDDVERAWAAHANGVVAKPIDFAKFVEVVQRTEEFFLAIVRRQGDAAGA